MKRPSQHSSRLHRHVAAWFTTGFAACALCACGAGNADFSLHDGAIRTKSAGPGIHVRWFFDLADAMEGRYVPVEQAAPGIDPQAGRVYVASTNEVLWALTADGQPVYRHRAGAAIEAQPVVDSTRDEVYALTVTGEVQALRGSDGSVRWKRTIGGALTQTGLLRDDALYVITEDETVVALARDDGSILWRYRRERSEGFSIAGHAGVTLSGHRLLTAFSDGVVVALDASDGRLLWETDTTTDVAETDDKRRFVDVDTTPVVIDDAVYVASYSAGLFALELKTGSVRAHYAALDGVVDLNATHDALLASSSAHGVVCLDLPELTLRWRTPMGQGAPGRSRVEGELVYVAESSGALLALDLQDGHEVGRLESGHGFTSPATLYGGRGFALSNAGRLFAFSYPN